MRYYRVDYQTYVPGSVQTTTKQQQTQNGKTPPLNAKPCQHSTSLLPSPSPAPSSSTCLSDLLSHLLLSPLPCLPQATTTRYRPRPPSYFCFHTEGPGPGFESRVRTRFYHQSLTTIGGSAGTGGYNKEGGWGWGTEILVQSFR